jgi:hypothetical protein
VTAFSEPLEQAVECRTRRQRHFAGAVLGFELADEFAPKPVAGPARALPVAFQHALEGFDDARVGAASDRGRADRPAVDEAEKADGLIGGATPLQEPKVRIAALFRHLALCGQFVDLCLLALSERRGRDVELWAGERPGGRSARNAIDDLGEVLLPPACPLLDFWWEFVEQRRRWQRAACSSSGLAIEGWVGEERVEGERHPFAALSGEVDGAGVQPAHVPDLPVEADPVADANGAGPCHQRARRTGEVMLSRLVRRPASSSPDQSRWNKQGRTTTGSPTSRASVPMVCSDLVTAPRRASVGSTAVKGWAATPTTSGAKSSSIRWSRSSRDSNATCVCVVANHHDPAKFRWPLNARGTRTGGRDSKRSDQASARSAVTSSRVIDLNVTCTPRSRRATAKVAAPADGIHRG